MPLETPTITPPDSGPGAELSRTLNAEKEANPQMVSVKTPTKFGMLMNLMAPMLEGAAVGGFTGKGHPGGGFGAAQDYFVQQRMRQMQAQQFLANMQKTQADVEKARAEAEWNLRRPGLTRTAPAIHGIGPSGEPVFMAQNPNTNQWEVINGISPEGPLPDYQTIGTNAGIVKYDKRGIAPTLPLTMQTQQSAAVGNQLPENIAPLANSELWGGPSRSDLQGPLPTKFNSGRPRMSASIPSAPPTAIPQILQPPPKQEREETPEQQDFDYLTTPKEKGGMGLTPDQAHARMRAQDRRPDESDQPLTGQRYNVARQKIQSALNRQFAESESRRKADLAALEKKHSTGEITDDEYASQRQQIEEDNADRKQAAHEQAAAEAQGMGINLGVVPNYREQLRGGGGRGATSGQEASGKTVTMDVVDAWARHSGISRDQALAQFKKRGYIVGNGSVR